MSVCSSERDAPDEHQMTDSQAVHAPLNTENEPCGDLSIRTLAMPADTNQNGDIFGGWLLIQMDIGGGIFASKIAKSRTVTVAIEAINFCSSATWFPSTPTWRGSARPRSRSTSRPGYCAARKCNRSW